MTTSIDNEAFDAFMSKVDLVQATISGLKDGSVSLDQSERVLSRIQPPLPPPSSHEESKEQLSPSQPPPLRPRRRRRLQPLLHQMPARALLLPLHLHPVQRPSPDPRREALAAEGQSRPPAGGEGRAQGEAPALPRLEGGQEARGVCLLSLLLPQSPPLPRLGQLRAVVLLRRRVAGVFQPHLRRAVLRPQRPRPSPPVRPVVRRPAPRARQRRLRPPRLSPRPPPLL